MVGQKHILEQIDVMLEKRTFPRFCIISAEEGMGKHTLCKYIADKLDRDIYDVEPKIEEIRKMNDFAYQYSSILFVLSESETGSLAYKNSMLKIIEEPPQNSYIILLTSNKKQLLPTILSRGYLFELTPYSKEELKEFETDELKLEMIQTPGLLIENKNLDINELKTYCDRVLDLMAKTFLGNCLKIPLKLKLKADGTGYDPLIFLAGLRYCNFQKRGNLDMAIAIDNLIMEFKNYLNMKAINKKYTMDEFIIKLHRLMNGGK